MLARVESFENIGLLKLIVVQRRVMYMVAHYMKQLNQMQFYNCSIGFYKKGCIKKVKIPINLIALMLKFY